jgi:hypothetical protein
MTSAMSWQGWLESVRPLITGIVEDRRAPSADHDGIDIAREDARGIPDRLAPAELHVVRIEHDGLAAELAHRHVEGDARPGRRLVEDHGEELALERLARVGLAARASGARALGRCRAVQDLPQLGRFDPVEIEKVPGRRHHLQSWHAASIFSIASAIWAFSTTMGG